MSQRSSIVTVSPTAIESLSESLNEPSWLRRFRLESLDRFNVLPEEQSNLYTKYSPQLSINLSDAVLGKQRQLAATADSMSLPELAEDMGTGLYYVSTQTETIASKNIRDLDRKGVVFCDFHEGLERHSQLLERIFANKAIKPSDDKYAAFNSALFSSGWLLYCPKDTVLETPLRIKSYINTSKPHVSQLWVYAEPGSQLSLLTESYGGDNSPFCSEVVEAYARDNSYVNFSNIQNYSEKMAVLTNKRAICGKDASMTWVLANFGGRLNRSRLDSVFDEDGASAEVVEIAFGSGSQDFDLVSDLTHRATSTRGRILSNSVLKDRARSIFKGMIRISKEAKNAGAYLAGHSILLSPNARSDAIPGLEISTNEVKATHSASVAQIDDDQIFYMMTRGIPEDEARKFIVLGFLEPGISRIQSEELRDTIRDLVEAKWQGKTGMIKRSKREVLFEEEVRSPQQEKKDIFEGHYKYR